MSNEQNEDRNLSVAVFMLALSIFLGRPSIVLPSQVSSGHLQAKKNPQPKLWGLCWHYRSVPGRPTYCRTVRDSPVDCHRRKKAPTFQSRLFCWHYLSSRVGQRIVAPSVTVRWTVTGAKKPRSFDRGCCVDVTHLPWTVPGIKKEPDFRLTLYVGVTYLPGQSPAKYCRRK